MLRARVAQRLPALDVPRIANFIGELVGVPAAGGDDVQLRAAREDAMLMGDQIRRACEDFTRAECAKRPVLLEVEDMHWGDSATAGVLTALLSNLTTCPLLALVIGRAELLGRFAELRNDPQAEHLELGGLSRASCSKLVRYVLGDSIDDSTVERLVRLAAGNAFCLEELIRARARGTHAVGPIVRCRLAGVGAGSGHRPLAHARTGPPDGW